MRDRLFRFAIAYIRSVQHMILPDMSRQFCSLVVDWHAKGQVSDVHMVEQL